MRGSRVAVQVRVIVYTLHCCEQGLERLIFSLRLKQFCIAQGAGSWSAIIGAA